MREELYRKLKTRLEALCINAAGEYYEPRTKQTWMTNCIPV